ncbi:MAG TPA: hypothetical protein VLI92_02305 [Candidatus Saccharimonadales bacterium]|nr:hypothetical protein [Candidatus Saccharimonadales bacterium]
MKDPVFVVHPSDRAAIARLRIMMEEITSVKRSNRKDPFGKSKVSFREVFRARPDEIAFFSLPREVTWPGGTFLCEVPYKLQQLHLVPDWAISTPLLVACRSQMPKPYCENNTMLGLAVKYVRWNPASDAPWKPYFTEEHRKGSGWQQFLNWQETVARLLGQRE